MHRPSPLSQRWSSLQPSASSSSSPLSPRLPLLLRTPHLPADQTCCGWCRPGCRRSALSSQWCRCSPTTNTEGSVDQFFKAPLFCDTLDTNLSMVGNTQDGKAKRQDMSAAAVGDEDAPEHLFLRWHSIIFTIRINFQTRFGRSGKTWGEK